MRFIPTTCIIICKEVNLSSKYFYVGPWIISMVGLRFSFIFGYYVTHFMLT